MNLKSDADLLPTIEAERYELREAPHYHFEITRRDLFKALGAGLLVLALSDSVAAQESGARRRPGQAGANNLDAWLHIGETGAVTVFTGKVEVGQNSRTALMQAVAEELCVAPANISMVMGDTNLTPYDMGTFGSMTTPRMAPILRRAAASAREQLVQLAVDHFGVASSALIAENSNVVTRTQPPKSVSYAELIKEKHLTQNLSTEVTLMPATTWKVAGTSVPKVDGRTFVTGAHKYASDIKRPGMQHGKVLRSPYIDGSLKAVDTTAATALPGVTVVHDGNFVGVTAPTQLEAERAIAAIKAEWTAKSSPSDSTLFQEMRPSKPVPVPGAVQASYTVAYIAHAPLEPRAAVAEWEGDNVTVWTGTQRPFGVRQELMDAFRLTDKQVHVLMPDTGSGYGGKHTVEAAIEAARLAKSAGKPVKIVWSRDEEFSWAYARPAGVIDISATVAMNGTITAWQHDNYNSGGSGIDSPYNIPGKRSQFHQAKSPLRQGSYRGLAGTANHFARESHMDDLARVCKLDPLAFRLMNCTDDRLAAVLKLAAERFGWAARKKKPGHGFGLAVGYEKGGYIANCVEVAIDPSGGKLTVLRVTAVFECGAVVNPTHLENQIEGAVVMGIGGALFEAIKFDQGKLSNPHFSSYRVPRFADVPPIDVVLINRKDLPSAGAGETPIMAIAPAIRNAILDSTGKALYNMPLTPTGHV